MIKIIFSRDYSRTSICERLGFLQPELKKNLLNSKNKGKKIIWFHAGSVGEVVIARELINELNKTSNNYSYIVSTSGRSGREMASRFFKDKTFLLPFDIPWIIKRIVKKIKPALVVIVEPDLWPNFIRYSSLYSNIILVNAWFNNGKIEQFKYLPGFFTAMLSYFDLISLQDKKYQGILKDVGFSSEKVKVTGNIKFDVGERSTRVNPEIIRKEYKIGDDKEIIIAGSTHSGEEEILLEIFSSLARDNEQLLLIIAPRHIERSTEIFELVQKKGYKVALRSELDSLKVEEVEPDIIILDTLGELLDLYSIATMVFVGGSLIQAGGHNLFEPLIYGKPVLFGPYISDVKEMAEIILDYGIGYMVENSEELLKRMVIILRDKRLQDRIKDLSMKLMEDQQGIIKKNIDFINEFVIK